MKKLNNINSSKNSFSIKNICIKEISNEDIPESIKPENIKVLLNQQDFDEKRKQINKKRFTRNRNIIISIAAVFVLVIGIGFYKPFSNWKVNTFINGVDDYSVVYKAIKSVDKNQNLSLFDKAVKSFDVDENKLNSIDMITPESSMDKEESNSFSLDNFNTSEFSNTNIQVKGVDEGDIVKTNGEIIIALSKNGIVNIIKKNDDGSLTNVNVIQSNNKTQEKSIEVFITNEGFLFITQDENKTKVYVYSLDDNYNAALIDSYFLDGYYFNSRMINEYFYIITEKENIFLNKNTAKSYIPQYTQNGTEKLVEAKDICILPFENNPRCLLLSGINLSEQEINNKAIYADYNDIYTSNNNMYMYGYDYMTDETQILKIKLENGKINITDECKIKGMILNQFSLDEYNNYLRVAVTKSNNIENRKNNAINSIEKQEQNIENTENALYILDENLNQISKLDNISKSESIYSVRFLQNTAYIATYYATDPLLAIDLSDVNKPKILSELKIPGFSKYLHPITENKMLGIGNNTSQDGSVNGLKVVLFDTSDKADIKQLDSFIIGGFADTLVNYNHKAFFYDENKNLLILPFVHQDKSLLEENGVIVLNIKEQISLNQKINVPTFDKDFDINIINFDYTYNAQRIFYIDENLYIYNYENIYIYDYNNLDNYSNLTYYKYLDKIDIK